MKTRNRGGHGGGDGLWERVFKSSSLPLVLAGPPVRIHDDRQHALAPGEEKEGDDESHAILINTAFGRATAVLLVIKILQVT